LIGKAIVDACVRAGQENRKFKVIILIPAVPGFAGDLRDDAAAGTRAIMDYQYKSLHRGENSIFGQIKAAGFDPEKYIFIFNLRSYDRLNKTAALKRQEEKSGVSYKDVQNAHAHEVMPAGLQSIKQHHTREDDDLAKESVSKSDARKMKEKLQRFEAAADDADVGADKVKTLDSIAKDAMLNGGKPSEEIWDENDPEQEKENFVQEELYIHSKLCIVDDKTVICGSSNINDRVCHFRLQFVFENAN